MGDGTAVQRPITGLAALWMEEPKDCSQTRKVSDGTYKRTTTMHRTRKVRDGISEQLLCTGLEKLGMV